VDTPARTLSRREAELVSWLEAERRPSVSLPVKQTLDWSDSVARNTLSRLAKKGWLRRTARGRYETILAETGGWAVPNPWAALSTWAQRYYVGFKSAAYEHGLTPDRPGSVQTCVPTGAKRPRAWDDIPILLIYLPKFDPAGSGSKRLASTCGSHRRRRSWSTAPTPLDAWGACSASLESSTVLPSTVSIGRRWSTSERRHLVGA